MTPPIAYLAPEIVAKKEYEPFMVDIWSMGVLLYIMLCGAVPFRASTLQELHKLILRCEYSLPNFLSDSVKDLIDRMLQPIPRLRISLEEMLGHPWVAGEEHAKDTETSQESEQHKSIMAQLLTLGFPSEYIKRSLMLDDLNHGTGTYRLLELQQSTSSN